MGELIKIDIEPGGMLSDVVENKLGYSQHQLVTNLRQVKKGLWESVPGYINHYLAAWGPVEIKAAIEVTDDLTGDRFILFQDATSLKKLPYDDGDGNGYENESPDTLSLPSGISIGADTVCKFFYFRGIVRITGPEDEEGNGVPLWYGHINRTLFPDAWEEIHLGGFETDTDGWVESSGAVLSQYDCDNDGDGAGMRCAPELKHALKVVQTHNGGRAWQQFTIESGKSIRVLVMAFRKTGGAGSIRLRLGSTAEGDDYGIVNTSTEGSWVMLEKTFTSTGTNLHVSLFPSSVANDNIAYFDFVLIEQSASIVIDEWILERAAMVSHQIRVNALEKMDGTFDEARIIFGKSFWNYDDSQFSLLNTLDNNIPHSYGDGSINLRVTGLDCELGKKLVTTSNVTWRLLFEINGSDLKNDFINKRLTRLGILLSIAESGEIAIDEDKIVWYVATDIAINEEMDNYIYTNEFKYDATHRNRLYFTWGGSVHAAIGDNFLYKGSRITLRTSGGDELETIVTRVSPTDDGITGNFFEIARPIHSILTSGGDVDQEITLGVSLERKWIYDPASGYSIYIGVDFLNDLVNEYYEYTDIPAGTIHNTPNYSHFAVVSERSYVVSREDEEDDVIRYSPIKQFDNHPILNICQTEVGDRDRNLVVLNRDDRVIILKRNSISQVHHHGSGFSQDIGFAKHGLYSEKGYVIIDNVLYFIDSDDIYTFDGNRIIPLLTNEKLKNLYQSYVDSSSTLFYDKMNKELIVCLNGYILVAHPEMGEWYKREINITPIGGFVDSDSQLILFSDYKFVNLNHSESTFDEDIGWEFKTKLVDLNSPGKFNSLEDLMLFCKSNGDIDISISDPNESRTYSEEGVTPDSGEIAPIQKYPDYLFKEVEITVKSNSDADDLVSSIKKLTLRVNKWQN